MLSSDGHQTLVSIESVSRHVKGMKDKITGVQAVPEFLFLRFRFLDFSLLSFEIHLYLLEIV